jgi:hypothetical protein
MGFRLRGWVSLLVYTICFSGKGLRGACLDVCLGACADLLNFYLKGLG